MDKPGQTYTLFGIFISGFLLVIQTSSDQINVLSATLYFLSLCIFGTHAIIQIWDGDFMEFYESMPLIESKKKDKMTISKVIASLGYLFLIIAGFAQIAKIGILT